MINRVYISNFRRIEEATIEIRDGITCLTGQNGTGKSSIIEAIEFCLYGKTKTGTNKDTIRRYGATDDEPTYVSVDFDIHDRHYRCRRYLTRKLSTQASLFAYDDEDYAKLLQVKDGETDLVTGQRSLGDLGTSIATAANGVTDAVSELFGIRYNEFIASFVARQKELDSLASSLTPEARKKFFLELLDYSRLDTLKTEYNREIRALNASLATLEKQLLSPTDIQRQIADTQKSLSELDGRISKGTKLVTESEQKVATIAANLTEMSVLSGQIETASRELETSRIRVTNGEEALKQLDVDEERYRQASAGYDPKMGIAGQLSETQGEIDRANAYIIQKREQDRDSGLLVQRQGELKKEEATVAKLTRETERKPEVDQASEAVTEAKANLGQLTGRKTMLDGEVAKIQSLIDSVRTGQVAVCPTCGTDISSEEGRHHLDSEMSRLTSDISDISQRIDNARNDVSTKEKSLANERRYLSTYQSNTKVLIQAESRCKSLTAEIEERTTTIRNRETYLSEHASENRTEFQLGKLEEKRADLAKKAQQEEDMQKAFVALQQTIARRPAYEAKLAELRQEVATREKFLADNKGFNERFVKRQAEKAEEDAKLAKYRQLLDDLRQKQGQGQATLRHLQEQLKVANEQARDRAAMRSQLETYIGAKEVVSFLREFLPAKIAPTLSARASKLLDVATNGMYRMIEINDSYEVSVYTDDDVRPIAMMSGGEQDIISLCIRIAIAEMILSTTGINRQTLILDEIFGALDDERRASACHALQGLGQMIPRIVCITHIEDIKDMADYTYVVERDENGVSHVREVIEDSLNLMPRMGAADGFEGTEGHGERKADMGE